MSYQYSIQRGLYPRRQSSPCARNDLFFWKLAKDFPPIASLHLCALSLHLGLTFSRQSGVSMTTAIFSLPLLTILVSGLSITQLSDTNQISHSNSFCLVLNMIISASMTDISALVCCKVNKQYQNTVTLLQIKIMRPIFLDTAVAHNFKRKY